MKLHEFEIREHRTGASRGRQPVTRDFGRIRRACIKATDPSRGEDDSRREYGDDLARRCRCEHADDAAVVHHQVDELVPGARLDLGPTPDCIGEHAHHLGARGVAARMHDAPRPMTGFASERETAFGVAVESRAERAQPLDAACGRLGHGPRDFGVAEAARNGERVGRVVRRIVTLGKRRRDPRLVRDRSSRYRAFPV